MKITYIKIIGPQPSHTRSIVVCKHTCNSFNEESLKNFNIHAIEAERIKILNENIKEAKKALDTFTHQHQSILYRLRNLFRHAN